MGRKNEQHWPFCRSGNPRGQARATRRVTCCALRVLSRNVILCFLSLYSYFYCFFIFEYVNGWETGSSHLLVMLLQCLLRATEDKAPNKTVIMLRVVSLLRIIRPVRGVCVLGFGEEQMGLRVRRMTLSDLVTLSFTAESSHLDYFSIRLVEQVAKLLISRHS